jgi:hypothetical protein
MPIRNDREYRNLGQFEFRSEPLDDGERRYIVDGYASTFEPYKLLTIDGVDYFERIEPTAFDGADMSDVVFLRDHTGRVLARTKNGSVQLEVDSIGLLTHTDLGRTGAAREMFEDIEARNYSQMSFSFTVADDDYEEATHTRVIKAFRKVYDISAVAFPANPGTDIGVSMRDYFNGVIEAEKAERLEAERRAQMIEKLKLRIKLERN